MNHATLYWIIISLKAKVKSSHWPEPLNSQTYSPSPLPCLAFLGPSSLLGYSFRMLDTLAHPCLSTSALFCLECSCPRHIIHHLYFQLHSGLCLNIPLAGRPSLKNDLNSKCHLAHPITLTLLYFPYYLTCRGFILMIAHCLLSQQNVSSMQAGIWFFSGNEKCAGHVEEA